MFCICPPHSAYLVVLLSRISFFGVGYISSFTQPEFCVLLDCFICVFHVGCLSVTDISIQFYGTTNIFTNYIQQPRPSSTGALYLGRVDTALFTFNVSQSTATPRSEVFDIMGYAYRSGLLRALDRASSLFSSSTSKRL